MSDKQEYYPIIATEENLRDPEPISFALALFSALVGGAGLAVQILLLKRERPKEPDLVKSPLYRADRALNRLDEAYRSLISIYDEFGILEIPFAPGREPFSVDNKLIAELRRIRANIFYGERDLQDALFELGVVLRGEESSYVMELSSKLETTFKKALGSRILLEFFIQLGWLFQLINEFIDRVAEQHSLELPSTRKSLISDTIGQLAQRIR